MQPKPSYLTDAQKENLHNMIIAIRRKGKNENDIKEIYEKSRESSSQVGASRQGYKMEMSKMGLFN